MFCVFLCPHRIPAPTYLLILKIRKDTEQSSNNSPVEALKIKFNWLGETYDWYVTDAPAVGTACRDLFRCAVAVLNDSRWLRQFQAQLQKFKVEQAGTESASVGYKL